MLQLGVLLIKIELRESVWRTLIIVFYWSLVEALNFLKMDNASDFCLIKYINVYLLYASTKKCNKSIQRGSWLPLLRRELVFTWLIKLSTHFINLTRTLVWSWLSLLTNNSRQERLCFFHLEKMDKIMQLNLKTTFFLVISSWKLMPLSYLGCF